MQRIQLNQVRLLDPVQQRDEITTVFLENGRLVQRMPAHDIDQVIDAQGQWLMPSMFDLCARLREPGQQQHGTLASEGRAARENGILHIVTPPDSQPIVQDNGALIHGLQDKAWLDGQVYLHIIGAQTQGLKGKQPANMAALKKGGCTAVSNANAAFENDDVVLRTLEYAAGLDMTVVFYSEVPEIAKDGCVHEGFIASRQGLPMIPAVAETIAIAKYLIMIEATGVRAHFGLLSCGASVALIQAAKAKGLAVTADVAMHQLHLTEQLIDGFNSLAHVRPPLRSELDLQQLRDGLSSGVIDAICSHHEPLNGSAKMAPFAETAPGISAFDSFVALGVQLVQQQLITPLQWVEQVSLKPAQIAQCMEKWQQQHGWVLVNPNLSWQLRPENMLSHGKNTPLLQQTLTGKVTQTFLPTA